MGFLAEAALLWSAAGLAVLLVVVPYWRGYRRRQRSFAERKEEAATLGFDRPPSQHPFIDPARCIGCGACVAACPEGDVLGIVRGTAVIINGLRCVGHARCEEACPVGAIEVGLGDVRARADVPVVDEWNETDVPGLFLVGEVTGLALVANAVSQGVRAVDRVAERVRLDGGRDGTDALDLVVVGAGPAGVSAALQAQHHGLRYVLLEQEKDLGGSILHYPRRKMVLVQPVDLPLHGRLRDQEYEKEALLELMESLVESHALNTSFDEKVTGVKLVGGALEVVTARTTVRARNVVLALGRRGTPRKLGVPGEELPKVMYRLVDAESYRSQRLLVVGGGDSAVEAAIGLARQPGNEVTLSYRRDRLVRIKRRNEERFAALLAEGRVQALFNSEVVEIGAGHVRLKAGQEKVELPNDYVFVFAGGEPPYAVLRAAGVRFGADAGAEGLGRPA